MKTSQEPPLRSGNQEVIRTCFEAPIAKIGHSHLTRQRYNGKLISQSVTNNQGTNKKPWQCLSRAQPQQRRTSSKTHNKDVPCCKPQITRLNLLTSKRRLTRTAVSACDESSPGIDGVLGEIQMEKTGCPPRRRGRKVVVQLGIPVGSGNVTV